MINKIVRYPMKSKSDTPIFSYLVETNMEMDYWLFDNFNDAVECAKKLNRQFNDMILIYDVYFSTSTREYYAQKTFWLWRDGRMVFDKHGDIELHLEFYINAGEWMNPRQDWIDLINRRYENVHE